MNVPFIAKKTYDEQKTNPEFQSLFAFVLQNLKRITDKLTKAKLIHQMVDEFNDEVFTHPLVKELSPCKLGCTACCHTQVSVTDAEAKLLAHRINNGVAIDRRLLQLQAKTKNNSDSFFKLKYEDRKCIFLGEDGGCRIYDDRPSVCRTNAVLGEASQCDTRNGLQPLRLIKTPKADVVIYASFVEAETSGALPSMVKSYLFTGPKKP